MATCPQHGAKWLHEETGHCSRCGVLNHKFVHGAAAGRTRKLGHHQFGGDIDSIIYDGQVTNMEEARKFGEFYQRVMKDPGRRAILGVEMRRPRGVSKSRHGIAIRAAGAEPMLNGPKNSIESRIDVSRGANHSARHLVKRRFKVKPDTMLAAKFSGGWMEREWTMWDLRYGPGYVIVAHHGSESPVYKSWHEAKTAIIAAGYKIID